MGSPLPTIRNLMSLSLVIYKFAMAEQCPSQLRLNLRDNQSGHLELIEYHLSLNNVYLWIFQPIYQDIIRFLITQHNSDSKKPCKEGNKERVRGRVKERKGG